MVSFLEKVLDAGGLGALLATVLGFAFLATVRVLWHRNQELHREINKLQEKRINEMQHLAERVIGGQHETTTELRRLTDSLDTLIRMQGGVR